MGPYDIGDRNNRVEPLLQFAQEKGNNTKKQTSPAGSGLGYHREVMTEICAEVCRAGMLSVIRHVAYGLILPPLAA